MLEESTPDSSAQGEGEKPSVPAKTTANDIVMAEGAPPDVLAMPLPDTSRSESKHYGWAEKLLERNGIRTVEQLRGLLNPQRPSAIGKAMEHRSDPGHVRAIDDLLLAAHGEKHIKATADTSCNPKRRPARLRAWLQQLAGAGMSMSDVPEDDQADGDHAS